MTQVSPAKNSKDMVDLQLTRFTTPYARERWKTRLMYPLLLIPNNITELNLRNRVISLVNQVDRKNEMNQ